MRRIRRRGFPSFTYIGAEMPRSWPLASITSAAGVQFLECPGGSIMLTRITVLFAVMGTAIGISLAAQPAHVDCRCLSAEETDLLCGGIEERDCGEASQCSDETECNPSASEADCLDTNKNYHPVVVQGATGKDCSVFDVTRTCDDAGEQEDCLQKWKCKINPVTKNCEQGNTVFKVNRAPLTCTSKKKS
jgi:hypothetical protein